MPIAEMPAMNIFLSQILFKQCSRKEKCAQFGQCGWLPATLEYFYHEKRTGKLRSICIVCHLAEKTAYRRAHPEKHRSDSRRYSTEHPEVRREWARVWRISSPEKAHEQDRRHDSKHRDQRKTSRKARYASQSDIEKERSRKRRTQRKLLPDTLTLTHWRNAVNYFNGCCSYCGKSPSFFDRHPVLHQDHFIPVASPKCEGTTPTNMVPACQSCNLSKQANNPEQWLISRFGKRRTKQILARINAYFDWVREQDS